MAGKQAIEAVRNNQFEQAYQLLRPTIEKQRHHHDEHFAFALASIALKKFDDCVKHVDYFLEIQPRDIFANLIKADALAATGKRKIATNFYLGALKIASTQEKLPTHIKKHLEYAQNFCEKSQSMFVDETQALRKKVVESNDNYSYRSTIAIDAMLGETSIYLQQPTKFYYPELPSIAFYQVETFPWIRNLIEAFEMIKSELMDVLRQDDYFSPYFSQNPIAPTTNNMGLDNDKSWSAIHLIKEGSKVEENYKRFPKTLSILDTLPIPQLAGKSPNILFSKLSAGAHIQPHHGQTNVRLLCHLPIICPENNTIRVGSRTHLFKAGEPVIFDDTIEHEAKNDSNNDRINLIFDIWQPQLTEQERSTIQTIFRTTESLN